jgi:hypothetical protein
MTNCENLKHLLQLLKVKNLSQKKLIQYLGLGHDKGHAFCVIKSHES